jgi:vacuolar-type H+-ATPase subunit F/Vma7
MPEEEKVSRTSEVAFLGSEDAALAFRAVGFDTFGVSDARAATEVWNRIVTAGYSTIFVSETLAVELRTLLEPYYLKPLPAVILLPERQPGVGLAAERIRRATIKAVGAEI